MLENSDSRNEKDFSPVQHLPQITVMVNFIVLLFTSAFNDEAVRHLDSVTFYPLLMLDIIRSNNSLLNTSNLWSRPVIQRILNSVTVHMMAVDLVTQSSLQSVLNGFVSTLISTDELNIKFLDRDDFLWETTDFVLGVLFKHNSVVYQKLLLFIIQLRIFISRDLFFNFLDFLEKRVFGERVIRVVFQ